VYVALNQLFKKPNMESLIKFVQDEFVTTKEFPEFAAGWF
jgi:hypothetical protein